MIPATYLLTSPDAPNAVGRTIPFTDLSAGLRRLNARVVIPSPREFAMSTGFTGLTCIYIGTPGTPGTVKVTAIRAGHIPEWSILRVDGTVQHKGWRAIFEKCIKARLATRSAIEREFRCFLDVDKQAKHYWCGRCQRAGQWTRADSAGNVCSLHKEVERDQERIAAGQHEMRERFPLLYKALQRTVHDAR